MARTTWATYIKTAGSWVLEGTGIYRPNDNMPIPKMSTQIEIPLTNGDLAFMTPSTKYLDGPMTFTWLWDDGTTKTKVEAYINNQNDVKIIDHDTNEYIGRFLAVESVQYVGQDPDRYDIKATFKIMPGLA